MAAGTADGACGRELGCVDGVSFGCACGEVRGEGGRERVAGAGTVNNYRLLSGMPAGYASGMGDAS